MTIIIFINVRSRLRVNSLKVNESLCKQTRKIL